MTTEVSRRALPGGVFMVLTLATLALGVVGIIRGGAAGSATEIIAGALLVALTGLLLRGLLIVNPNEAAVLVLFGRYTGTIKTNGFFWVNPFAARRRVSLRARNLSGEKLKVNDKNGNPIEIAAVIVWQIEETARAVFDVNDYERYVVVQSEAAVRHLAGAYPYDASDEEPQVVSLRGHPDEVSVMLEQELGARLERAGVHVLEARLSHLAYAPEIAEAMLRRQQAAAVVAARSLIVTGAVGMVEMALEKLCERNVVELDEERKAAMVSNLLVVLCSESAAAPVLNAGTLHH
jgi:regulator of protease activity HflC (stomatin/prohibitin superfamily)